MMENEGFQVTDEIDVPNLEDIKEQRTLKPAAKDVLFSIVSAAIITTNNKDIKSLDLRLRIVDGIDVMDKDSGEMEKKFIGAIMPTGHMTLVVWADKMVGERPNSDWWKNDQHMVGFKQFCMALDIPLSGIKVNDDFLASLAGREVRATIVHEEETVKDAEGKKQKTGTFREKLRFWKKA